MKTHYITFYSLTNKKFVNIFYLLFFILISFTSFLIISNIKQYITPLYPIWEYGLSIDEEPFIENDQEIYEDDKITDNHSQLIDNISIKKGDNLEKILYKQQLSPSEVKEIINLLKSQSIINNLKIGQELIFYYRIDITENEKEDLTSCQRHLEKIEIYSKNKLSKLTVIRQDTHFVINNQTIPLKKSLIASTSIIKNNLISTLKNIGLDSNNISEIIHAYSYDIDFERQIKNGDKLMVVIEQFFTEDGKFSHNGKIIHASLMLEGKERNIYFYKMKDNIDQYFNDEGKTTRRSLLRTPLDLIKISSKYGARKHPTLGYTKMHKGVDFSAPTGTPIYAAGNGIVTDIGWRSGYGNMIQIKHSHTLTTLYAHASKFAKGIKKGQKVKQGQVIAHVGMTGRATGPHLHYEVKIDGKNVNPTSVKTSAGFVLKGKELENFNRFKEKIKKVTTKLITKEDNIKQIIDFVL